MIKLYFIPLLLIIGINGCGEEEVPGSGCGKMVIISQADFDNTINDAGQSISVKNPRIVGNCLTVTLGYSGCNDGHSMDLITSGDIAESLPPQAIFIIRDNEPQLCLAFFTEEYSFDITPFTDLLSSEKSCRLIFHQKEVEILWEK